MVISIQPDLEKATTMYWFHSNRAEGKPPKSLLLIQSFIQDSALLFADVEIDVKIEFLDSPNQPVGSNLCAMFSYETARALNSAPFETFQLMKENKWEFIDVKKIQSRRDELREELKYHRKCNKCDFIELNHDDMNEHINDDHIHDDHTFKPKEKQNTTVESKEETFDEVSSDNDEKVQVEKQQTWDEKEQVEKQEKLDEKEDEAIVEEKQHEPILTCELEQENTKFEETLYEVSTDNDQKETWDEKQETLEVFTLVKDSLVCKKCPFKKFSNKKDCKKSMLQHYQKKHLENENENFDQCEYMPKQMDEKISDDEFLQVKKLKFNDEENLEDYLKNCPCPDQKIKAIRFFNFRKRAKNSVKRLKINKMLENM